MKTVLVNVFVGVIKVLFHAFGLCKTCCKTEKKEVSHEKTQDESQGK